MTPEQLAALRAPFAEDQIELLPKPLTRSDGKQPRVKCETPDANGVVCGGYHTMPVIHLSYVGHAGITMRLLDVDPEWNWEPVSTDAFGLPQLDGNGGLWIRLTVCGVTRLGYGDSVTGGSQHQKEVIGDAIRNAAMRFGVATYLWSKSDEALIMRHEAPPARRVREPRPAARKAAAPAPAPVARPAAPVPDDLPESVLREAFVATTEKGVTLNDLRSIWHAHGEHLDQPFTVDGETVSLRGIILAQQKALGG